jgi:DNA-binding Lrp family transcriptional regulator
MVTAIVLIQVEPGSVGPAAEGLSALPGVSEVYSVAGEWDLVAILRVAGNEDLADLVTSRLATAPGVVATETLIAFRAYSRHDLERLFSIGMER